VVGGVFDVVVVVVGGTVVVVGGGSVVVGTGPVEMKRVTGEPFGTFACGAGTVRVTEPAGTVALDSCWVLIWVKPARFSVWIA
jgi:hypothetical protein